MRGMLWLLATISLGCTGNGGKDELPGPTDDPTIDTDDTGTTGPVDADQDGATIGVDCDDDDPDVNPDTIEVPYDGIDNDCSSATPDDDLDQDGYNVADDCDDDDADVSPAMPEVPGDGLDNDCDPYTCAVGGFDPTGQDWNLPNGYLPGAFDDVEAQESADCPAWVLRDLDGSGPDLVVTDPCQGPVDAWALHANTGSGFAAAARWALPVAYAFDSFTRASEAASCPDNPGYTTADVDGDDQLDLIVLSSCTDPMVGTVKWDVHLGTSGGFADAATEWSLPTGYGAGAFMEWSQTAPACGQSRPAYDILDADGDGFVDLLITQDPCDPTTLGTTEWHLHGGSATGFADVPTPWSLPVTGYGGGTTAPFPTTDPGTPDCLEGRGQYMIADADGDGVVDLVVVETPCSDQGVGLDYWNVHLGTVAGFPDLANQWALPAGFGVLGQAKPFSEPELGSPVCSVNAPAFTARDIDADGDLDLVLLEDPCSVGDLGVTRWDVYLGGPSGLVTPPVFWSLPAEYGATSATPPWGSLQTSVPGCLSDIPEYGTVDVTGDGALDIAVVQDCGADVGTDHWRLFDAICVL